jgi:hypothetical protein
VKPSCNCSSVSKAFNSAQRSTKELWKHRQKGEVIMSSTLSQDRNESHNPVEAQDLPRRQSTSNNPL